MTSITRLFIPSFALFAFSTATITAVAATPEDTGRTAIINSAQVPPTNLIDINSASLTDLRSLPGIGTARAKQLVAGRPYSSIDEIKTRKIMSKSAYDKIRDRIKVERNAGAGGGERQGISAPRMNRH
jgi:competence protein ComEA